MQPPKKLTPNEIYLQVFSPLKVKKNLLFRLAPFFERFNQSFSKYIPAEHKIMKNKNSEDFLLNTKQVFSGRNMEKFTGEYGG